MTNKVALACESRVAKVSVDKILPLKLVSRAIRESVKYKQIAASIREVGVIEPLVVHPKAGTDGQYLLLDGSIRFEVLKEQGEQQVLCLVATDDEAFTYNHKVNRLTPIQEHFMIMKAIKSGVPESRIAKTLNVDVSAIFRKRDLLEGICAEAVSLLKDKGVMAGALREMKKVKPMRQIEMVELMCATHNFSAAYAKCLLAATPDEQLLESTQPKDVNGLTADEMARMENEMETIARDFKLIEESHGRNVLNLVIVVGYVKRLIGNARVVRYLSQFCPEILMEFQKLAAARSLGDEVGSAAD